MNGVEIKANLHSTINERAMNCISKRRTSKDRGCHSHALVTETGKLSVELALSSRSVGENALKKRACIADIQSTTESKSMPSINKLIQVHLILRNIIIIKL